MSGFSLKWRVAALHDVPGADQLTEVDLHQRTTRGGKPGCVTCGKAIPPSQRRLWARPWFCSEADAATYGRWVAEQIYLAAPNPDYVPPRPRDG